jgi:aspartate/methionine/tyrosine aminotransferase
MMTAKIPDQADTDRFVSAKAASLWLSGIKEMAILSARIDDAVSLAWGIPSFPTPQYIIQAVIEQLGADKDIGKYALPDGLNELKQLVARKHRLDTGISVDADEHVMITAGNMQGMYSLLHVIINPGDEIIVTDPCFASHIQQVILSGGKPVYCALDEDNGWSLDIDALSGLISENTKAIIINSPSNPTGKIFSRNNLLRIGELAKTHQFMIIIDDPYSHFTYENREKYFNLATEIELFENTAYLYSFSKAYAMSGWRLGYMILPAHLKTQVIKVHDLNMICTPRVSQAAGIAALSGDTQHLAEFEAAFAKRRELICQRLDALPHVFGYVKPEGAYYIFPRILTEHTSARDFCLELLNKCSVALSPGSAFGPSGENHVRMTYCVSEETINLSFDRLEAQFGKD